MVYIGHFSFMRNHDDDRRKEQLYHGYFTTVAEAENVENAMEKFEVLIRKLYQDGGIFDDIEEVFLDACIECKEIPSTGFLAHYTEWLGEETGRISTSIRGASDDQVAAYYIGSDDQDEDDEDSEGRTVEPFVVFDDYKD